MGPASAAGRSQPLPGGGCCFGCQDPGDGRGHGSGGNGAAGASSNSLDWLPVASEIQSTSAFISWPTDGPWFNIFGFG